MKTQELDALTKVILTLGLLILLYGFLSRIIPIDFFWESKYLGFILLLIGLIGVLNYNMKKRKALDKKNLFLKIGIGLICFTLLTQILLYTIFLNSDAYSHAKKHIKSNEDIISEIGNIDSFSLIPTGGISFESNVNGETGNASINLIIKGDKKYKNVTVFMFKDYGQDWIIESIED